MRMGSFVVACWLIWSGAALAQVSGNCYLEAETDHSGTTVLFTSASISAVTDSTVTDALGAYSISLATGLYEVSFAHEGFLPLTLPDPVMALTTPLSLDDVTLEAGQYIELSGSTGDLHIPTGSIVRIVDLTRVAADDTLIVDPGVRFLFPGYDTLIIDGYAEFNGTEADSIIFESEIPGAGANAWSQISIRGADVIMQYCVIRHCNSLAIDNQISGPPAEFEHCRIEHASIGVSANLGATFRFRDCVIEDCYGYSVLVGNSWGTLEDHVFERCLFRNTLYQYTDAVKVQSSTLHLIDCVIDADDPTMTHRYGVEILENNYVEMKGCVISDCWEAGIRIQGGSAQLLIENCLVTGNEIGFLADPLLLGVIRNNTIVDNTNEGLWFDGAGSAEVSHNILSGNGTGIYFQSSSGSVIYNDIWDNDVDITGEDIPAYFGQTLTTNANGDPADIYFNIFLSPAFANAAGGDYALLANSPCIDAGDPVLLDPDGTAADLGAFYYDQSLTSVQIPTKREMKVSCSPNPFNPKTEVTFYVTCDGPANLSVFDIRGRRVADLFNGHATAGLNTVSWNGTDLSGRRMASGVYLLSLTTGEGVVTEKVLLAK